MWYRRRATIAGVIVVALVGVAVVTDLPTHAGRAQQISDARSFVTEAYGYVRSCNAGLTEAFGIAAQVAKHEISAANLFRVPDLLRDDHLACSYTNDDVFQLASMTIPRSLAESNLFASAVLSWIVPDAYGVTGAITVLVNTPRNSASSAQLRLWDERLTADRSRATRALNAMERQLGTTLPPIPLVRVPPGPPPLAAR